MLLLGATRHFDCQIEIEWKTQRLQQTQPTASGTGAREWTGVWQTTGCFPETTSLKLCFEGVLEPHGLFHTASQGTSSPLFTLLPSGRRYRSWKRRKTRFQNSFLPRYHSWTADLCTTSSLVRVYNCAPAQLCCTFHHVHCTSDTMQIPDYCTIVFLLFTFLCCFFILYLYFYTPASGQTAEFHDTEKLACFCS